MSEKVNIFWFRRDLRLDDNVGFLEALKSDLPVLPIFIFDKEILDHLPEDDARVTFIFEELQRMRSNLQENHDSSLAMFYGKPLSIWQEIIDNYEVNAVYTNRDYEPYAQERDLKLTSFFNDQKIEFFTYKDQVIYEKDDIVKGDGDPYVVYTPYKNKWLENFRNDFGKADNLTIHYTSEYLDNCIKNSRLPNLDLSDMGFKKSDIEIPDYNVKPTLIEDYEKTRNFPALENGTSRLGVYLRFGVVSIRKMMKKADLASEKTFMSELIWREFFMTILYHFPHTVDKAFRSKYDRIEWRNNEAEFEKWKNGQTGYAIVDAGMRELNTTGYMHNRVRMLVASFLCKHLLIDWRWGERYFAEKLLDFDLSANVGNWQWAAGSGVDAAPYFRIFNPITQKDKFDKNYKYIKQWVPEFDTDNYVEKMVDHKEARERCLKTYKEAVA
ncbi:cryptochrome/photolyase family protein [Nonlabens ulvanivorans]|uniref:Deoxyribodipyrimidine photo-lyase n=1 Tax=Nonlabens ulvanivorans TaxID=906888 RepID=A0A084JWI4_NONUL|nr:deoxyribodipyrimidine photo-lyase [Nonlabens ulvanivorans]KEZ93318.1 deoxyribodipyrimidine photolyase [Nonlabens ulvanivorans]PRX13557.1 deoxyribodipyrimidine photo-lyase [Nonlabens ulvanivorans]